MELFASKAGYMPSFISVISEENERQALDHVKLAKQLGTTCKLNNVMPFGKSTSYYSRAKILELYCDVIDLGLVAYESNTAMLKHGSCPFNTCGKCAISNRAVMFVDGKPKYSYCEDLLYGKYCQEDSISRLSSRHYDSLKHVPQKCLCCRAC